MRYFVLIGLLGIAYSQKAMPGKYCKPNQVVNRLTVYDDGALEAECGEIPCGESGRRCLDDQTSCRAETDVFSGMKWAPSGQSLLMRCCTISIPNKIYVGTDLVTAGSFYVGGQVAEKDLYGNGGAEYDFIANVRTEQGGVRVWVYRIMCGTQEQEDATEEHAHEDQQQPKQEKQDLEEPHGESRQPFNPLRYRPPHSPRASTGSRA
ncbi:hypothetical protein WR25_00387 [Diploscapter pachys]|uniref:WxxW domain-containing protein n=1 Tax=Diploscapter pachys TaxID=2018661 RepID=A0A2A2JZ15_9BILA|nr:hypothetical protein WR25_00387 [Diploscapter pachys]